MKYLIPILACLMLAGCGEEFAAGVGTGMVAMTKMSENVQTRFIETVNALDAETARLKTEIGAVQNIDVGAFVKPETIAAIDSLKERGSDPITWVALASVLGGAFFGGQSFANRKKVGG